MGSFVVSNGQYATVALVKQIGLQPKALVNVDDDTVNQAITDASGLINSALQQFTLPIISVDYDIVQCCVNLSRQIILDRRGYNPDALPDRRVMDSATASQTWLERVANGTRKPSNIVDSAPGGRPATPYITSQPPDGWNLLGVPCGWPRY